MSRKKIVAATMVAAALGLAFAGYTATRANGTDEVPKPLQAWPLKADAGYRQNHQIGHNGTSFEWLDAANLNHTEDKQTGPGAVAVLGQDSDAIETVEDELTPVSIQHANRVAPGTFAGFGLAGHGGGGTPKTGDNWSGGRFASSYGGFGGFGGFIGGGGGGGGSPSVHTKGPSGTNDPSSDSPQPDAPALENNGTEDQPGTNEPQGPPVNPPAEQKDPDPQTVTPPPTGPKDLIEPNPIQPGPTDPIEPGPIEPGPIDPGKPGAGPGDTTPPPSDVNVPEPATLGLLGFGMIAAAALRRRRRGE